MESIKVWEIAQALGLHSDSTAEVTAICTDSREAGEGSLFVAIPGERVDGHDYVNRALAQGAGVALVEHTGDFPPERTLLVENTVAAMGVLSAWYRRRFSLQVVGVTGSVGKTTTKDMIAAVLEAGFTTIKTQGNQNNQIGAPRTLFSIDSATQAAVVEMGMSGLGEIAALADAAQPQIGVITNVGINHLEYLGTRENILRAKLELADALPDGAPLFLCSDNDLLQGVEIPRLHVVYYGLDGGRAQLRGEITQDTGHATHFTIHWQGKSWQASVPGTGRHLVQNALAAFGVGVTLGLEPQTAIRALQNYQPSGMRQHMVEKNGITIVEDCYNASPDSMAAALRTLRDYPCTGRRMAVLSDMLELGSMEEEGHRATGRLAAQAGLHSLWLWGRCAPLYQQGAVEAGMQNVHIYRQKAELAADLAKELRPGDMVWFKASRGQKLEEAMERLYQLLDSGNQS